MQGKSLSMLRTKSLMDSFNKVGGSFLGTQAPKNVLHLTNPNIRPVEKDEFLKQQDCQICFITFGRVNRQHHCRACANAVCGSCSASTINNQRACDLCVFRQYNLANENKKKEIITALKILNKQLLGKKIQEQTKLKDVEKQISEIEGNQNTQEQSFERTMADLQKKIIAVKQSKEKLEAQLASIKSS